MHRTRWDCKLKCLQEPGWEDKWHRKPMRSSGPRAGLDMSCPKARKIKLLKDVYQTKQNKSASHLFSCMPPSLTTSGKQSLEIYFLGEQRSGPQLGREERMEESGWFQGQLQKSTEFGELLNGEYMRKSKVKAEFCVWMTCQDDSAVNIRNTRGGRIGRDDDSHPNMPVWGNKGRSSYGHQALINVGMESEKELRLEIQRWDSFAVARQKGRWEKLYWTDIYWTHLLAPLCAEGWDLLLTLERILFTCITIRISGLNACPVQKLSRGENYEVPVKSLAKKHTRRVCVLWH